MVAAVSVGSNGQILGDVWCFEARHPEWTEDEGGEEGWEPIVSWWAVSTPLGLVLIDPLVDDWTALDELVHAKGGCAGIVRTCHWHQRSVAAAAPRYHAEVWAAAHPPERGWPAFDCEVGDRQELFDRIVALEMERHDEIALWLPTQRALMFGDAMLRGRDGRLQAGPPSWTQPEGGRARLLSLLRELTELPVEHVLVSHGPTVLGDGLASLRAATS
jgi:glyoxylase-like metal-dependent hydrolase (beta-lactamase superfamily II)